jgi:hypothetical protein
MAIQFLADNPTDDPMLAAARLLDEAVAFALRAEQEPHKVNRKIYEALALARLRQGHAAQQSTRGGGRRA